jgi:hypothetical protein
LSLATRQAHFWMEGDKKPHGYQLHGVLF